MWSPHLTASCFLLPVSCFLMNRSFIGSFIGFIPFLLYIGVVHVSSLILKATSFLQALLEVKGQGRCDLKCCWHNISRMNLKDFCQIWHKHLFGPEGGCSILEVKGRREVAAQWE